MNNLVQAIKVLQDGGIIIFPTDTAFGIGCRIDDATATARLFNIRKRPEAQATPVLVDSIGTAEKFLHSPLPNNVRHLMEDYWPGALTIIYKCKLTKVPPLVRGGGKNLGVRMPNHDITLSLIKGVKVPILGPSANFHGQDTPYRSDQIDQKLMSLVDYVVEGDCKLQEVSTVIDCSAKPWKILRQGAVKINLNEYL